MRRAVGVGRARGLGREASRSSPPAPASPTAGPSTVNAPRPPTSHAGRVSKQQLAAEAHDRAREARAPARTRAPGRGRSRSPCRVGPASARRRSGAQPAPAARPQQLVVVVAVRLRARPARPPSPNAASASSTTWQRPARRSTVSPWIREKSCHTKSRARRAILDAMTATAQTPTAPRDAHARRRPPDRLRPRPLGRLVPALARPARPRPRGDDRRARRRLDDHRARCTRTQLARPAGRHAGLYHYALLYPTREELARAAVRLSRDRDPDRRRVRPPHPRGDLPARPRRQRHRARRRPPARPLARRPRLRRRPRAAGLPRAARHDRGRGAGAAGRRGPAHGPPAPARRRHRARAARSTATCSASRCRRTSAPPRSSSAGGYHHHLGFNVWRGPGVGPAPEHTVGLRHWTVELPRPELDAVRARLSTSTTPRTSRAASSSATRGARRSRS